MANFTVSVERNTNGTYQVRSKDKNGLRKTHYGGIGSRTDAKDLADMVKKKWLLGELGETDSAHVTEELFEKFTADREQIGVAEATLLHYDASFKSFLRDTKAMNLVQITDPCLKDWLGMMRTQKLKDHTIRGRLADLRTFLNWCVENKFLTISPFGKKTMPKQPTALPRFWSDEDFWNVDEALAKIHPQMQLACRFAFFAGLRFGEAIAVFGEDIRWTSNVDAEALIWRSIHGDEDDDYIGTKTDKPRVIPLSPSILEMIPKRVGRLTPDLTYDIAQHIFSNARKMSGIDPQKTIHGLRHSFCKNYLQNGRGSTRSLMELTGHKSIKMMEVYGHFEQSFQRQCIVRMFEESMRAKALNNCSQGHILQGNYGMKEAFSKENEGFQGNDEEVNNVEDKI